MYIQVLDKNIVCTRSKDHAQVTVEDLIDTRMVVRELLNNEPDCLLIESGKYSNMDPKGKKAFANKTINPETIATAIMVDRTYVKILTAIFFKVYKPKGEVKVFVNKEKAISWLKEKRDEFFSLEKDNKREVIENV